MLDLLSLAAAYGVLVAVTRFGVASSWLHTYHVSQIEGWVPILIFAVLFGLSMDYEVFIVTRIREGVDRGLSSNEAIEAGLANTGGVVSSAALIMVGAMSGFVTGRVAGIQELGVGLGAGVSWTQRLFVPSSCRASWHCSAGGIGGYQRRSKTGSRRSSRSS